MLGYEFKNLKGDISGGLIAGIIALPLALAFGVQSGMGAAAGLYGAIAVGIFAAMFGGTPTQASGPTGPMTVVSAAIVVYAVQAAGDLESGLGIVLLCFLAGGVFQILLGFLGVGKYIRYFPYPVVSGFMSGVGLIIIILQLWPLLGSKSPKSTIEVFTKISEPLATINVWAVVLGVLTIAVNYGFPRITKKVPSVLVALLVGTGVAIALRLDVPVIGDIPSGFPPLRISSFLSVSSEHYVFILQSGMTLALLGSIDSLLTSVIADNITKDQHNSKRELIGQGIGNVVASVFGGIPGAGATKGTVVAINAGAKTRLSGITHGLFQLLALLGLGTLVSYIPLSVLAGLLISVGFAIIDYRSLGHLKYIPRADAVVMIVVLIWTVFGNLIHAVAAGVVLASILFMKQSSDLAESASTIKKLEPEPPWPDEEAVADDPSIYVKHLYGPLFFGFTSGFRTLSESLPSSAKILVVRMERVPSIDQSGLYTLEDTLLQLNKAGKTVTLTGLQTQPEDMLRRIGIIPNLVPEDQVFKTFESFVKREQS
ncbi:Bicarbonate transporter BicA [Rubripirellula obstinata]|uniref:Bicarbonate transporter BicA n=1 Tax=Rubripirellula obstinata TaxID=406547 RepID=A0A5B1CHU5_9BACT|nr:SulP family inorganic anion transporter [Rubripirellula obstinata]KAA1258824.1 Bicarbonate transporter BicA [Rubripirellula obstinata]